MLPSLMLATKATSFIANANESAVAGFKGIITKGRSAPGNAQRRFKGCWPRQNSLGLIQPLG